MEFLKALRQEPTSKVPIWLMRQAGRYMASYRALREKHTLLELVKTPELACEVTLQPIQAFHLDAAIIFSDILPILESLGLELEFIEGEGPLLKNPIRDKKFLETLQSKPLQESVGFTLEAIRLVKPELKVPLIGFSGAPFTLACYAIEGGGSKEFRLAKTFMYNEPELWDQLMSHLSELVASYLIAQSKAGIDVLQIFDSWAGALSPQDYQRFVFPYTQKTIRMAQQSSKPIIYFSTGTGSYLNLIDSLGANAYSLDWRSDLNFQFSKNVAVQGNLDPIILLSSWEEIKKQVDFILRKAPKTGFIFNLGHGILQQTPETNIRRLTEHLLNDNQNN